MTLQEEFLLALHLSWAGRLGYDQVVDLGCRLSAQGQPALAIALYLTWLRRNRSPQEPFVWFNLGVLLSNEGDLIGARDAYREAIRLAPGFVQPRFNLGLVYERLGDVEAAVAEWRWLDDHISPDLVDQRPILIQALNNLGRLLEERRHYYSALAYLVKSLTIDPHQPDVLHHWIFLRQRLCQWPVYDPPPGVDPDLMRRSTSALGLLSLTDDPETQLAAARRYVATKVATRVPPLALAKGYRHDRIRVGYCSSDFCLHPVAMLTVELFELHDRQQFEVYGYCWTREDQSPLRQRVIKAMDRFYRIGALTDEQAARLIREHEIDILIDLHGQTLGARPNLLAYRPAPIQITYLGLPATTGFPFIDYVIADRFLIPEETARFYSEKPIYMPEVYMVCDRRRQHAPIPSRQECGLPEQGFVFCSFNNNYKFTPEMFSAWMTILKHVPGSVLWLLADNPWAEINLRREARARQVEPERLRFAPRVAPEQYLARFGVADLFLDTFPFNAGTTANDALWMGLPVLTLCGRAFAARMAGALLTAARLPDLITYDLDSYIQRAIALGNSPALVQKYRAHLAREKAEGVLFDTPRFVRHLEAHFQRLVRESA